MMPFNIFLLYIIPLSLNLKLIGKEKVDHLSYFAPNVSPYFRLRPSPNPNLQPPLSLDDD